jgi:DHA1 family tetracycline resistance protein-like MFS transporter
MRQQRAGISFIFITLLIDMLGIGLLLPILPKLVETLLGGSVAEASIAYAVILSVYALMQFLCAPLIGVLSDRFGRRPIILVAVLGLVVHYLGLVFAPDLLWVIVARVIGGAFGATVTPVSAYIADVSPPEKRAANFGLIGVALGLSFVVGPAVGGILGEINLRLPFAVAAGLALANLVFGLVALPESLRPELRQAVLLRRANPIGSLQAVLRYPVVAGLLPVYLTALLSHLGLQSLWVPYATFRYGWSAIEVGLSLALIGALLALSQGVLVGRLVQRYGEMRTLTGGLAIGAVSMAAYGFASEGWLLLAVSIGYIPALGVMQPSLRSLMSGGVPPTEQGLLQGALASSNTLMGVLGPMLANTTFAYFIGSSAPVYAPGMPFFVGGGLFLAALALAVRQLRRWATPDALAPKPMAP